jgi:hypothetical protein
MLDFNSPSLARFRDGLASITSWLLGLCSSDCGTPARVSSLDLLLLSANGLRPGRMQANPYRLLLSALPRSPGTQHGRGFISWRNPAHCCLSKRRKRIDKDCATLRSLAREARLRADYFSEPDEDGEDDSPAHRAAVLVDVCRRL